LSPGSSRTKEVFEPLEYEEVVKMWQSRFAVAEDAFEGCRFYKKAQSVWVCSDADLPRLRYEAIGMRMMSLKDRPWKPTTCALQIFGKHATKNVLHLSPDQAAAFMAGETQDVSLDPEPEAGYVVVFYNGRVLGCGLYSRGRLISQIPRERRIMREEGDDI
jgi:NOL1/NOP2/fmu family ribosome biogenesis protein